MGVKTCHDCSVKTGEQHLPGCDWEECPFCRRQLLSCRCCYEKLGLDPEQEPTFSQGLNDKQSELWEEMLKNKGFILYGQEQRFDKK